MSITARSSIDFLGQAARPTCVKLAAVLCAALACSCPSLAAEATPKDEPGAKAQNDDARAGDEAKAGDDAKAAPSKKLAANDSQGENAKAKAAAKNDAPMPEKPLKKERIAAITASTAGKQLTQTAKQTSAPPLEKHVIGPTAVVVEQQSEFPFLARVDTGAASCSLHIEEFKIEDEAEEMTENVGKSVRFQIKNNAGETYWVESKIERLVKVRTSEKSEVRYKAPVTLLWKEVEKRVLVTLNNRQHMVHPLLLGRNFLEGEFLVDVGMKATK